MNRTVIRTLVGVACSAALVTSFAGCGSNDKAGDSTPTTLTAAEFKTQANAICKAQDAAEAAAFTAAQKAGSSGDTSGADAALQQGVAVIRGESTALGALKPPAELSADAAALVTSLNAALDKVASEGVAALVDGAFDDATAKATALGLTECGN